MVRSSARRLVLAMACFSCGSRTQLFGADHAAPDAGAVDAVDASIPVPVRDAGTVDAALDAGVVDAGPPPPLGALRLLAPLSTARVRSITPGLSFVLPPTADGAEVTLCRDRACNQHVITFRAQGAKGTVPVPLTPGPYFWHAVATRGAELGSVTTPTWEFFVGYDVPTPHLDSSWGTVLDLNGDGIADVVTGARATPWGVHLYLGSTSGFPHFGLPGTLVPEAIPDSVSSAGDVNGDGFCDLIAVATHGTTVWMPTGANVYLGGANGLSAPTWLSSLPTGTVMKYSVAGVGDVNADGYGDVVVGATTGNGGSVSLFVGGPSGLTPSTVVSAASYGFGDYVATAGDVNGDGYADVIVSARPTVSLLMGGKAGLAPTPIVLQGGISAGRGAQCAGDVNGDGYTDVIMGSYAGLAILGFGGPSGVTMGPVLQDANPKYGGGFGVGRAGDLNQDGFDDVIATDVTDRSNIYYGGPSIAVDPSFSFRYGNQNEIVGSLGDVNGDGFEDLGLAMYGADSTIIFMGRAGSLDTTQSPIYLDGGMSLARLLAPVKPTRHGSRASRLLRGGR